MSMFMSNSISNILQTFFSIWTVAKPIFGAPTLDIGYFFFRTHHQPVVVFLIQSHGTTGRIMCLKYHVVLCNSAKTPHLPAYHGFECWYANILHPMIHFPRMLPIPSEFALPTHLH